MSACETLTETATFGAAPALRAVDCLANETAGAAFGRLFGAEGALMPALTILLTLYIAFFAISLLTGRSRIGISALTPRAMTLGLVLTFATSWVAYQGVFWNLAIGAPDQLAGILTGGSGSATKIFADKLDVVFAAIAQAADAASPGGAQGGAQGAAASAQQGTFTGANLMWLAALLLLLGTVGVLVTARIALAVLLAVGPIFVVFALFSGTRGLCAGWLRGVVMTAITPLFVVVGGSLMLELIVPVLARLVSEGQIDGQAAMALFLVAAVHASLMGMILKVTATMVSAWGVFGLDGKADAEKPHPLVAAPPVPAYGSDAASPIQTTPTASRRAAALVPASAAAAPTADAAPASVSTRHTSRTVIASAASSGGMTTHSHLPSLRGRGVGSRFRPRPSQSREMMK